MSPSHAISAGFSDPVHDAQNTFRGVLNALSRPGKRFALGAPVRGVLLGAAMAHLLLALTDDDTAVWWQRSDRAAADWLRFHTGATRTADPQLAAFAVLTSAADLPPLDAFAAGSLEAPERSTTWLLEVASLDDGPALQWRGPGIKTVELVRIAGLPGHFWSQWQANHASFPQGLDIVFTCAGTALGLPRTTRIGRLEEI